MKIKSLIAVTALFCFAIMLAACGGPAANNTNAAKPGDAKPATKADAPKTDAPKTDAPKTEVAGDSIGVPECDDYIKKYEACLTKIAAKAPAVEGPMKQAFETARKGWKDAAANPATKATLGTACKQALETAKTSTSVYACEW